MLLRFGKTHVLDPVPSPDPATSLGIIEHLFQAFIVDIYVDAIDGRIFKVDAFKFLYTLLARLYCLYESESFVIETLEGFSISADCQSQGDFYHVTFLCEPSSSYTCRMTTAEMIVFLSATITEVVKSIEAAGIDVGAYIRKYKPALF